MVGRQAPAYCGSMMADVMGSDEGAALPSRSHSSPALRILVVEDEPSIRQSIINSLASVGYRVDAAADGAAAWEALQYREYDLMITDNTMPKVTGISLVQKLRRRGSTMPVVMASGAEPTRELAQNPALRISAFLLKPFTAEEMLHTVRTSLHPMPPGGGQPDQRELKL